jgi:hypothetical protein
MMARFYRTVILRVYEEDEIELKERGVKLIATGYDQGAEHILGYDQGGDSLESPPLRDLDKERDTLSDAPSPPLDINLSRKEDHETED